MNNHGKLKHWLKTSRIQFSQYTHPVPSALASIPAPIAILPRFLSSANTPHNNSGSVYVLEERTLRQCRNWLWIWTRKLPLFAQRPRNSLSLSLLVSGLDQIQLHCNSVSHSSSRIAHSQGKWKIYLMFYDNLKRMWFPALSHIGWRSPCNVTGTWTEIGCAVSLVKIRRRHAKLKPFLKNLIFFQCPPPDDK